jgi:hypothetical protein
MTSRVTVIELTTASSLNDGIKAAIANKHRIVKIEVSRPLYNSVVQNIQFGRLDNDEAVRPLLNTFDVTTRKGLNAGDACGVLYGVDVLLNDQLPSRTLRVESEPV